VNITAEQILNLSEGAEVEIKAALGRDGQGELPRSFWSSYSAMANTDGGVILLGIREVSRGIFEAVGLKDASKIKKTLWDGLNDKAQISINLLAEPAVEDVQIGGKTILRITVPRARRSQRPVYCGRNPISGTYQRRYEGDYLCDEESVRRMLAEQVEDERDSRLLAGFGVADLDPETVRAYRNAVKTAKPSLPWHESDDAEFLAALGALRRDRETGAVGLTLGGLLMMGKLPAIQEAVPHYMLDYQERPTQRSEMRWVDRVTTEGEWSGNLFDFCRIVLRKLYKDLPVPFQLTAATRVDESPVHVALREALVNTLVHADFTGRVSILIVKRPDLFGFRNPGAMRVSLDEALVGGMSDCRNRILQRLFRMAGYSEQAGQGIPTIYAGWRKQLWRAPILHERRDDFEQTVLTMPLISLLSEETVAALEARFGARYRSLPETQQMALATVAVEGRVSHARLKTMVLDHPRDITAALAALCREGFLQSAGLARGKYYFFPGESASEEEPLLFEGGAGSSEQKASRSEHLAGSSEHNDGPSSEHNGPSSEHNDRSSEHWIRLLDVAKRVRDSKRAPREVIDETIVSLCSGTYLSLRELRDLLGRGGDSLRVHYLSRLAKQGRIRLRFPESQNHPNQAYIATQSD
jgi:predicted HTH transcriptional regulator